jgi:hypothetical protein
MPPWLIVQLRPSDPTFCGQKFDLGGQDHAVGLTGQPDHLADCTDVRGAGVNVDVGLGAFDIFWGDIVHMDRDIERFKQVAEKQGPFGNTETAGMTSRSSASDRGKGTSIIFQICV